MGKARDLARLSPNTSGQLPTANIEDSAITSAKIADLTVGAGDLANSLDLNSKSLVLPSNAGSSLVRVADTGTITTGTSITIDNCFSTQYRVYKVYAMMFAPTSGGSMTFPGLRLRTGGVSGSDVTTGYKWRSYRHYTGITTYESDVNDNDPIFRLAWQTRYDYGTYYEWTIYSPAHSVRTHVQGNQIGTHENQEQSFHHHFYGSMNDATAHTGLRLFQYNGATANISNGRIVVYGVKDGII